MLFLPILAVVQRRHLHGTSDTVCSRLQNTIRNQQSLRALRHDTRRTNQDR